MSDCNNLKLLSHSWVFRFAQDRLRRPLPKVVVGVKKHPRRNSVCEVFQGVRRAPYDLAGSEGYHIHPGSGHPQAQVPWTNPDGADLKLLTQTLLHQSLGVFRHIFDKDDIVLPSILSVKRLVADELRVSILQSFPHHRES